jgi:hypothetical protein
MKKYLILAIITPLFLLAVAIGHPNLGEAQKLLNKAIIKIDAAQKANEFDLGGFAEKAKNAIRDAKEQIKIATKAADEGEPLKVQSSYSSPPEMDTYYKNHPNIAEAQKLVSWAYDKITAAQKANEFDMEGHAQKAKNFLDKANELLKKAAQTANEKSK